jgi:hypothetical protein
MQTFYSRAYWKPLFPGAIFEPNMAKTVSFSVDFVAG